MKPKHLRLLGYVGLLCSAGLGLGLTLYSFQNYVSFYQTPTQILAQKSQASLGKKWRLGGYVQAHSLTYHKTGSVSFIVHDETSHISVTYQGQLPQLFKEKQGVVLDGSFEGKTFIATRVLAKHDEQYTSKKRELNTP